MIRPRWRSKADCRPSSQWPAAPAGTASAASSRPPRQGTISPQITGTSRMRARRRRAKSQLNRTMPIRWNHFRPGGQNGTQTPSRFSAARNFLYILNYTAARPFSRAFRRYKGGQLKVKGSACSAVSRRAVESSFHRSHQVAFVGTRVNRRGPATRPARHDPSRYAASVA